MARKNEMRDFGLEVFFSQWEFTAEHHMTASDMESLAVSDLLGMASDDDRAGFEALWLGYTETWGAPDLRAEIASSYETMEAGNVLCLAGAGEGIYAVSRVLLNADDHVLVPAPNYQSAETVPLSICEVTGLPLRRAVSSPSNSEADPPEWRLDLDDLKAALRPNTKLISLNFPHNPTGMLMPHEDLQALVALCRAKGIYIFSDEVYRGVELNTAHRLPQIADIYEKGISLGVMSKAYGLPGLRLGWIASQDLELLQKVERYKHYLSICNSGPSERLSLIALKALARILERNRAILRENVALLQRLLDDFPGLVEFRPPLGGCVAFPKFIGPGGGEKFCRLLIEDSGVLLLPSSIYVSEIADTPQDHFRIGLGRDAIVKAGLTAMRRHFEKHYASFAR